MGDQNINQTDMFNRYVKYSVDVPKVMNDNDYWYFNRCVNEAFTKVLYEEKGPIHINFRMNYRLDELSYFPEKELPKTRYIETLQKDINWKEASDFLKNKKILILCGSESKDSDLVKKQILEFKSKTNTVILSDYYSNLLDEEIINPCIIGESYHNKYLNKLKPDLIIMTGSVVYTPIKSNRKLFEKDVETWEISEDGRLNDGFRNVKKIYKTSTLEFFKNINKNINDDESFSNEFCSNWKNIVELVQFPDLQFTNFNAIKKFMEVIPENSTIHMSVLDAIRISNYCKIPPTTKCFANIGADGIDGALSTFLGQASLSENLSFLLIGDLSLMYDMNGLCNNISNNVRILAINNYAGAEFHKNFGLEKISTLNDYIAAGHKSIMKNVVSINNFKYLFASNSEQLEENLRKFVKKDDKPIILEVFTDADTDAKKLKEFWNINRLRLTDKKEVLLRKIYNKLGKNIKEKIDKIIRK